MASKNKKKYSRSLFIFRRDLRLQDNTGLLEACNASESVILCFIVDPKQVQEANEYRSLHALQFMIESLHDLQKQCKKQNGALHIFYGHPEQVMKKLIQKHAIDALFCNRDYTPYSVARDKALESVCKASHIDFIQTHDLLLHEPEAIKTNAGKPYCVFTAFYKKALEYPIPQPQKFTTHAFGTEKIESETLDSIIKKIGLKMHLDVAIPGGSSNGEALLKSLNAQKNYAKERDFPALDATSHLSAHLKFGTVSIRQTYHAIVHTLGHNHPLLRQLYWRDFFTHIAYHFPFVFGHPYHAKYNNIWWENNTTKFKAWCQGKTGFPIVDAGMRELNQTGYMHNRVRMIVASFLVKDLHIDWRWGEKYFAQQLVDYDPCVNNGNWQWAASTGCDAQPYFRIFNPWLQQKKFDPQCEYIKKWVPELKATAPAVIHTLSKEKHAATVRYPSPLCDHAQEAALAKRIYRKI